MLKEGKIQSIFDDEGKYTEQEQELVIEIDPKIIGYDNGEDEESHNKIIIESPGLLQPDYQSLSGR